MPTSPEVATPAVLAFLTLTSFAAVLRVRGSPPSPGVPGGSLEADPRQGDGPGPAWQPPVPGAVHGAADGARPQGEPGLGDHAGPSPDDLGSTGDARGGAGGDDRPPGRDRVDGKALVRAWHRAAYARYGDERR